MQNKHDDLQALKNSTWVTSGSRFNAEERLRKRHSAQLWSIAVLSVVSIVITIIPHFFDFINEDLRLSSACSFYSSTISIGILSLSFYTASMNNSSIADAFHKCAKALRSLNKEVCYLCSTDTDFDFFKVNGRYDIIMNECPYNHSNLDRLLFYADKHMDKWVKETNPLSSKMIKLVKFRHHLSSYCPYYSTAVFLMGTGILTFILYIWDMNSVTS